MLVGIYIDGLAASCSQRWRRSTSHLAEALMWLTQTHTQNSMQTEIKINCSDVNWDFPAAGEMREVIFWPIPGVKEGVFDSSGFSAEAIFIFVFVVFHRGSYVATVSDFRKITGPRASFFHLHRQHPDVAPIRRDKLSSHLQSSVVWRL